MSIPFIDLAAQQRLIRDKVDARIAKVLDHGAFILGPEVAELEKALAEFAGARHALAVASGTDALQIVLMAHGVGPGDAVFVPTFTFTATAEVVLLLGAQPIFVDVDEATFNIDLDDLAARVGAVKAEGKLRPRGIIAVDLYGLPADYDRLHAIAKANDLFVLADAAQSFGGAKGGRRVGALTHTTATSFYPAKPLGCYGDGGAVFTDDDEMLAALRSIHNHGQGTARYDVVRLGVNSRLDTIQAAVLLVKLEIFADEIAAREQAARWYDARLAGHVKTPPRATDAQSAWAQYTIRVANRDAVVAKLRDKGIPTAVHYPRPMHLQPAYAPHGGGPGSLPMSERMAAEVLSLPMHPYMDEATVETICAGIIDAVK